jgi:general secretion pathway protein D
LFTIRRAWWGRLNDFETFQRLPEICGCKNGGLLQSVNSAAIGIAVDMHGCGHFYVLARSGWALLMLTLVATILAGCVTSNKQGGGQGSGQGGGRPPAASLDVLEQIREVDLGPRSPQNVRSTETVRPTEAQRDASYYGDGTPVIAVAGRSTGSPQGDDGPTTTGALTEGAQPSAGGQGYEMNFENTPVATVAKAILGDILGLGYTIDPRVQGMVSLSSGRPVPKKDLLYVLESALRVANVALVREARGYRLVPVADAAGTGSIDRDQGLEAGYGITAVPLQHVSAQTLTKLLDNFATKPGTVRADPSRNLVVIQGNGADRRAAIDTVLSFDADWMRGQSVGIYPVSNSTPEPIILELERIIDAGEGGLSQNVVKLQPIGRQNAILVVSRKPEYLTTVSTWIRRLDKSGGAGTALRVYRMRYGDARQTAALLNEVFTGNSNGLDSSANQLAPGGGVVASSSRRPNLAGFQQGAGAQQTPAASGSQQLSAPAPSNFDARFADASGGRFGQNSTGPTAGYGYGGSPNGGLGMGGPGPALPNVKISPDVINNTLLIYANQEHFRIIERALQQIDRPQLQVAIDATIAEVTLNDKLSYGVQFFLKSKDVGLQPNTGSIANTASATSTVLSRMIPGFNFLVGTEADPRMILDALHTVTDVKILSTPSLVVLDNQFASLLVGDQIPITTRTAQSVDVPTAPIVNSIDYRNTGVILRVAPRINANGNVLLDVEQEISAVAQTSTADTLTPTVSQRKVKSSIAVASGQTVLLGGLISERQDKGSSGVPGLDQVPGIGVLFSRRSGTIQRTELIIFIRPQIIRHGVDARRVAEELRGKMRGMFNAPPPPPPVITGPPVNK